MILTLYDERNLLSGRQRQIVVPLVRQDMETPQIVRYGELTACVDTTTNRVAVTRLQPGVVVPFKHVDGEFVVERIEVRRCQDAARECRIVEWGVSFSVYYKYKWDGYYGPGVRKVLRYGTVQMHAKGHPKNTDIYSWDKNPWCWVYHVIAYEKDRQVHRVQG